MSRSGGIARSAGTTASTGIDPRSIGRELSERRRELKDIQKSLAGADRPDLARDASRMLRHLNRMNAEKLLEDPEELTRLRSQIIQGLQQLELEISRALAESGEGQLRLAGPDEVPPQYRSRVDEYYKDLATRKKQN